jgi:hypothetical protein
LSDKGKASVGGAKANKNMIESGYKRRIAELTEDEELLLRWDRRFGRLRVLLFSLSALSVAGGVLVRDGTTLFVIAGILFVGFVATVDRHDRLWQRLTEVRRLRQLCRNGVARLRRRWNELPVWETAIPPESESLVVDLDLFGRASLFQLVGAVGTNIGRRTLQDWLLGRPTTEEIVLRQDAVAELAEQSELRERLNLLGNLLQAGSTGPERFVAWAEDDPWLMRRPWLIWITRLSPVLSLAVLILTFTSWLSATVGGLTVVALLLFHCLLSVVFTAAVHDVFRTVSTRNNEAAKYRDMFRLICDTTAQATKLRELQADLGRGSTLKRLAQLQRIMWLANISHSPFLVLPYLLLQILALWDFHVLYRLEVWQQRNGDSVRPWFVALGQFESLSGLATTAYEHPSWPFPQVDASAETIVAKDMGHPLLPEDGRVGNDVQIGPTGTFLLITGSNMSGKSTLLRALGTNAVLALAGGPVCAKSMVLPPVDVATSMRIRDSLADGVSFFMAELYRLKEIVDLAKTYAGRNDVRLLFLLDEILQGTNSRERHIAVQRVVRHLLDCRAIGAISTHDVELASSEGLVDACRAVHFREQLGAAAGGTMSFDYQMREGVATTTNALKLLELVGLKEPGENEG